MKTWLLTVLLFSYSIYVRQENCLLLVPFLLGIFIYKPPKLNNLKKNWLKILFLIISLIVFQLSFLNWYIFHNPFNTYETPYHLKYFLVKAPMTVAIFFNSAPLNMNISHSIYYNTIVSAFFLASILLIFSRKEKKNTLFLFTWLGVYFVFFSFFFDQGFVMVGYSLITATGDYIRRTLLFHIPYSILAASVLYWLMRWFRGIYKKILIFVLILIIILPVRGLVHPSLFKDIRPSTPELDYFSAVNNTLNGCSVITTKYVVVTSDYFEDNARKAIDIEIINENNLLLIVSYLRHQECAVFFKDYRCKDHHYDFQCGFINKYLNATYLYSTGGIEVFNMSLK